ncbi:MAG TPA: TIGR00300 family protein [Lacipirellulaceae bacterium]|nr:TIGR00300 family protein [Lacipirellulaceae bacterium]
MTTKEIIVEEVEITGHIIDSLILPKVLDTITANGGTFRIAKITIGQARHDPSSAVIEVRAATPERMHKILAQIADHGAVPTTKQDCKLVPADMDGAFPEGFYSTTNQQTEIRINNAWIDVADQEMDCGIVVEEVARDEERGAGGKDSGAEALAPRSSQLTPRCIPMTEVRRGMPIVTGHAGTRVIPVERTQVRGDFTFMSSGVSTEKPKGALVQEIARDLVRNRRTGQGKTLIVGGPAIVHTGSGPALCQLIRGGYVNKLFAGNALATHDIEQSLFGTSLGVHLADASLADAGHEHHLRAINRIRRCGSIRSAVDQGVIKSGIMFECVRNNVEFLLAGSIRDDGPLPDVITDTLEAQRKMREGIRDVTFCLMIATTLHSVAVGNLLPAWVKVVCVDINPSSVIKLSDRGSFQTLGIVTDVEPFLRALVQEVQLMEI